MNTTNTSKEYIFKILHHDQDKIRLLGVRRLGLFGSFVRQEQNDDSDIDFLVEFEEGKKSFDNFIQLSFLLEHIFKRHIELVTPEGISPYIAPYILKEVEYATFSD